MIVISPYSRSLPNGNVNPKNYPHWEQVIQLIPDKIIQVGIDGDKPLVEDVRLNLSLKQLIDLLHSSRTWISCDSMIQHLGWHIKKPGIVLWGQSDPLIFGHPENVNLLKSREYLYSKQFLSWDMIPLRNDCWVAPDEVVQALNQHFPL